MNIDLLITNLKSKFIEAPPSYSKKSHYTFGSTLGYGTFGIVKTVKHKETGQKYAVKIISKEKIKDKDYLVKNELETVKKLHHENIVGFYDYFESNKKHYFVFELCEGGELFERLEINGKFTEKDASNYIFQILNAIKYTHDKDIVHRDIKPENLLFKNKSENSTLKLADFGISKVVENNNNQLTTQCGSISYVAPEVIGNTGDGYGKAVDMWGIGITTYILLCGHHPFGNFNGFKSWLEKLNNKRYTYNSYCWTLISDEAKDFIDGLLQPDPEQRMDINNALKHPWISEKTSKNENLVGIRENFNPKSIYRKAFDKLKVVNKFNELKNTTIITSSTSQQDSSDNK